MAHHASAKKRIRQDGKKRHANRLIIATVRTHIKRFRAAVDEGDKTAAAELIQPAVGGLDRAVSKGCMHWRTAARKISRLNRALNKI